MSRFILVSILCSIVGCKSMNDGIIALTDRFIGEDNTEPPSVLVKIDPQVTIETLWKKNVGIGCDGQLVNLALAVASDKVIAADRNGLIQAHDYKTGKIIWEVETELPISAGPGLGMGTVLVGTSNAELIALSLDDGSSLWTVNVSSEVLSVPTAADGIVVVKTIDGRVLGLDEDDGKQLWSYERQVPALSLRGTSTPVISDDLVIHGFANGKVVALQLNNGKQAWESIIAVPRGRSEVDRLVDIDADPIVVDGVVYAASYQGGVSAISSFGGELLWRKDEVSSFAGMSVDWRYLYLTDEHSDIWQLDQRNGSALWKQTELHQRQLTAPAVHKNYIAVADFEGYVHWLSTDDGRQLGRKRVSRGPIEAKPVVVGDILYVYSKAGVLAALSIE